MLQFSGLVLALATFMSIWLGHVGVRWLEAQSVRLEPPMIGLILAGTVLNVVSFVMPNLSVAGVCSIVGITLLWDAFELVRQQKRVTKGHAPANPHNPRHAAILAAHPAATTAHVLDREPLGRPVAQRAGDGQTAKGALR